MSAPSAVATSEPEASDELFWNLMGRFERQALAQYRGHVSELSLAGKEAGLRDLEQLVPSTVPLPSGALCDSTNGLVESSAALAARVDVLVGQGLVLEQVRCSVYAAIARSPNANARTQTLASAASAASAAVLGHCVRLFSAEVSEAERFSRFVEASDDLLRRLDSFGEEVDNTFGDSFSVRFADVVGDFVAELIPICTGLGMDRRKVLGHFTCALMGF